MQVEHTPALHGLAFGHGEIMGRTVNGDGHLGQRLVFAALGHFLLGQSPLLTFVEQLELDLIRL
jgi:hypothetical protein